MKKILFLMLSLAVSASAFAGVNKMAFSKSSQANAVSKTMAAKKHVSAAPIIDLAQKHAIATADVKAGKKVQSRTVVTDQPAGTVKYYDRTGGTSVHRYYDSTASSPWSGLEYTEQSGMVITVENGNVVWIKNILYDPDGYFDDYWVQGTKTSNRITIQTGQELLNYSDGSSIVLYMGTLTNNSGSLSWTRGSSTTIRFQISGNNLTLQNSTETGTASGTCLGCDWDDGYGWAGFADFATVLTLNESPVEAPTMYSDDDVTAMAENGGEMVAYVRDGAAIIVEGSELFLDTQGGITYIYYAENGDVYMRDPVYGWDAGYWVKGTKNGNKITVPLGQYVAWTSTFLGLKTSWGTFVNGSGYTADPTVTECTYTINDKYISLDNSTYDDTEDAETLVGLALTLDSAYVDKGWYGCLDAATIYWMAPDVPADVTVTPAATTADVAWDGGETEEWNLRYRQYNPDSENYFCDFEDASEWSIFDMDGDGNYWGYRSAGYDGYCVTSASWTSTAGALTPDNWLVSPEVALNGIVRFMAWGQDPLWPSEVIRVYVTTNPDYETTDDFVALSEDIIVTALDSANIGNNTYIFDLSEYAGQRGCIAIRHYNVSDVFMVNVDNFYVGDPDAPVYEWINVNGITEIPYTIEGLLPETMYEVQVAGVNGNAIGIWTDSTIFTTLAETSNYLRGDVDNDGFVKISDVTALINALLSGNFEDGENFNSENADCDLDGTYKIGDVTALINYLLSGNW